MPTGWKRTHVPEGLIGEILLHGGEAGDGLAGDKRLATGQPRVAEQRHAMAQGRADPAGLVELCELGVQVGRGLEGEHRTLAAGDDDGIEAVLVDLVDWPRGLDELEELRLVLVAAADDILGLPQAGV